MVNLTPTECQALQYRSEGKTVKETTAELHNDAKEYLDVALHKLKAKNAAHTMALAIRRKLIKGPPLKQPTQPLDEREITAGRLMRQGLSNGQIGVEMKVSETSAKNYLGRIYQKFDTTDRVHAAALLEIFDPQ